MAVEYVLAAVAVEARSRARRGPAARPRYLPAGVFGQRILAAAGEHLEVAVWQPSRERDEEGRRITRRRLPSARDARPGT
jgi:hypothetical protein